MKISIIGYSGSGKSTLAHDISNSYSIPALHLDTVHWLPGWKERPRSEEIEIVAAFLNNNSSWVIDGTYSRVCYDRRMEESDQIIFMSFNRVSSLLRIIKRYFQYKGKTRYSMTDGCPERINLDFILWVLYKGRTKKYRENYKKIMDNYGSKVITVKNQRQLDIVRKNIIEKGAI